MLAPRTWWRAMRGAGVPSSAPPEANGNACLPVLHKWPSLGESKDDLLGLTLGSTGE